MKKRGLLFLLSALIATSALAATEVHEGQKFLYGPGGEPLMLYSPSDSLGRALREGGTTGSLSSDDIDRDRDHFVYTEDIGLGSSLESGAVRLYEGLSVGTVDDSSDVITVGDYRRMSLAISIRADSISLVTGVVNVAIQMRFHAFGSSDSSRTYMVPVDQIDHLLVGGFFGWGALSSPTTTKNHWEAHVSIPLSKVTGYGTTIVGRNWLVPLNHGESLPAYMTHVSFRIRISSAPGTNTTPWLVHAGLLRSSL